MADRKNQHFVPRCALRPFSLGGEGRAINTFLIEHERPIRHASMKNQCSRDYFYGDDLKLENALAHIEGHYARLLKTLVEGRDLSPTDQDWLLLFTVVQTRRTEQAINELAAWQESFAKEAFKRDPSQQPPPMTHRQLIALSMSAGLEMHERAKDLKFVILRNKTATDFITSDDPAVLTNKFHHERNLGGGFGIINSGIILVLPLTPRLVALFFDIGIYTISIPRGTRFVEVTSAADVIAINHLQCINAHKNLYFFNWDRSSVVAESAADAANHRQHNKFEIETLVHDPALPGESYRRGSATEEAASSQFLIRTSHAPPRPSTWPRLLKYRPKPVIFDNRTAVGPVRKEEWLSSDGRMKGRINALRRRGEDS